MKIDGCFKVFPVSKPTSLLLNGLDFGIQSFTKRIRDRMSIVGQDIVNVFVNYAGHLDDRLEAGMSRPEVPLFEVTVSPSPAGILPEFPEALLDGPRTASPKVHGFQCIKPILVLLGKILLRIQPKILGSGQRLFASLTHFPMFLFAHGVASFPHMGIPGTPIKDI